MFSLTHSVRIAAFFHSTFPPVCLVLFVSVLRVLFLYDAVILLFCVTGVFFFGSALLFFCVLFGCFYEHSGGAASCLPFAILIGPLPLYAAS